MVALWSTQGGFRINFNGGLLFTPFITYYSLKDIKLVPNLATEACGGTVVYPGGF